MTPVAEAATAKNIGNGPGGGALVVMLSLSLITLFDFGIPGTYLVPTLALLVVWGAAGMGWATWLIIALLRRQTRARLRASWRRWARVPAVVVAVGALLLTHTPLNARLALSAGALAKAARAAEHGQTPVGTKRVGMFAVSDIEIDARSGVVLFTTNPGGTIGPAGLAYSPQRNRPAHFDGMYQHLYGPWYEWHRTD